MAYDKNDYKLKRKNGERGQGPKLVGKFYPKGTKVTFVNSKGEEKEWPNGVGEHLVRSPGKGLQYLNRKQSRQINRRTPATKQNYEYQHDKLGFSHEVGENEVVKPRSPKVSNHTAHRERQLMREASRAK
jgi:hypothetical protein